VEQAGQHYIFSVEDTGPGITEESQKRIFEPFQQAEEGEAKGGTGLGLASTLRHIELMGGILGLESTPGEGSCFTFELELPPAEGELILKSEQKGQLCRLRPFLVPGKRVKFICPAACANACLPPPGSTP
jgi:two-component system sensor histidine kinase TorS